MGVVLLLLLLPLQKQNQARDFSSNNENRVSARPSFLTSHGSLFKNSSAAPLPPLSPIPPLKYFGTDWDPRTAAAYIPTPRQKQRENYTSTSVFSTVAPSLLRATQRVAYLHRCPCVSYTAADRGAHIGAAKPKSRPQRPNKNLQTRSFFFFLGMMASWLPSAVDDSSYNYPPPASSLG